MRHGADPAAAPPRGLRVGRDADGAGDVRGVAVARLHAVVVVAGREVEDRLAARGAHDLAHVARDQRAPRERAEVDRLEVAEERVVALDRHHGLPRLDLVAVVEGVHDELVPAGLPASPSAPSRPLHSRSTAIASSMPPSTDWWRWKTCMSTRGWCAVALEHLLREDEVGVRVVALAHLLDREVEDLRRQPPARAGLGAHALGCGLLRREQRGERLLGDLELGLARLGRRERALQRRARDRPAPARAERAGVPLAPGEQLERDADRRQRADRGRRAAAASAAPARRAPRRRRRRAAAARRGASRSARAPWRSSSAATPLLVAGHGLVLGAVVAHEVAAAQGDERRHDADQRRGELAAEAAAPAHDGRQRRADDGRGGDAAVLEREAARRAAAGGSAAASRTSRTCARRRARTARGRRRACAGACRSRPGCSPSGVRTAAAQDVGPNSASPLRSAIPPRRSFSSLMSSPIQSGRCSARRRAPPVRGRARRCARRARGPCRAARVPCGATERNRRRSSRRPPAGSASR